MSDSMMKTIETRVFEAWAKISGVQTKDITKETIFGDDSKAINLLKELGVEKYRNSLLSPKETLGNLITNLCWPIISF